MRRPAQRPDGNPSLLSILEPPKDAGDSHSYFRPYQAAGGIVCGQAGYLTLKRDVKKSASDRSAELSISFQVAPHIVATHPVWRVRAVSDFADRRRPAAGQRICGGDQTSTFKES